MILHTGRQCSCTACETPLWRGLTELKNDYACLTCADPVGETVGAKISTWATHSEWKTLESLLFAIKFQLVFRYETVVFRRYVLAPLLVVLLRKFEAYLVCLSFIWGTIPRRFSCFQKFRHLSYIFHVSPRKLVIVFQLCRSQSRSQSPRVFWSAPRHGALE